MESILSVQKGDQRKRNSSRPCPVPA